MDHPVIETLAMDRLSHSNANGPSEMSRAAAINWAAMNGIIDCKEILASEHRSFHYKIMMQSLFQPGICETFNLDSSLYSMPRWYSWGLELIFAQLNLCLKINVSAFMSLAFHAQVLCCRLDLATSD